MYKLSHSSYCFSQPARLSFIFTLLFVLLGLAACGGGGNGNGQPDPNPQYPAAVEEISSADISNAGLPDINSLASISSKSGSMLSFPDDKQLEINLSLGWDGVLASHNLSEAGDGAGWQVSAPQGETKRVLAWAIYAIPATEDAHLWKLEYEMSKSNPGLPVFYAVANQTQGSWEIGGRIVMKDGSDNITLENYFSQSQDYVMPNGNAYLAILVGHPGNGNYNNGICTFGQCACTGLLDSASENYPNEEYSMQWSPDSFSLIKDGTSNTLGFNIGMPPTASQRVLLGTNREDLLAFWSNHPGGVNFLAAALFYDLHEANAAAHPFQLETDNGETSGFANGTPLQDITGNGTANGIIAILIALTGPVPNIPVNIYIDDIIIGATSTDGRGRFSFDGLEEGHYSLLAGDPDKPLVLGELEVTKYGEVLVGLLLPAVQ